MKKCTQGKGIAFSCIFLSFLLLFSVLNAGLFLSPATRFLRGEISFSDAANEIRAAYVSDISFKPFFIDLNGAYARLSGRRTYHGVSVMENGMLDRESLPKTDMAALSDGLLHMSSMLSEHGIAFLFVQVPSKVDLSNALVSFGAENAANQNADELCASLSEGGVEVLDLRPRITGSIADVERFYYRTDHHWNADGAFCAFGAVLERISAMLPHRTVDLLWTDAQRWERSVYPRWFLGSHGKRVGRAFGGVDDLILYTPKETSVSTLTVPHKEMRREGAFSDVLIFDEYLDAPDHHGENPYCAYLGGDYPLALHENRSQENGAHVLLIKDSFSLPLQAMLSTSLSRLDVIDPRYYREKSVLEYAKETHPDLVIVAINPSVFSESVYADLGQ